MITHETIDGRPAVVAYINDSFEPVAPDVATMIKVIFDDGEIRFGKKVVPGAEEKEAARVKALWQEEKHRALALLQRYNEEHDPFSGRFTGPGGGGGEGSASPIKGYSLGIKARGQAAADQHRDQEWVAKSPLKTSEDVINAALIAQNNFQAAAGPAAKRVGVTFKNPGSKVHLVQKDAGGKPVRDASGNPVYQKDANGNPKRNEGGVERFKQKLAAKPGAPAARITDLARGAFVLDSEAKGNEILNEMAKTHEITDEGWRTIQDTGYTDRAALFRDPETGLIGEIQLSHPGMLKAKMEQGGHDMYVKARDALAKGVEARNAGNTEAQKKYEAEAEDWNRKMRALYEPILDSLPPEWKMIDGRKGR